MSPFYKLISVGPVSGKEHGVGGIRMKKNQKKRIEAKLKGQHQNTPSL